jgi:pyrimidine operon attenuation protein/uracil phosphoribosyltransferase
MSLQEVLLEADDIGRIITRMCHEILEVHHGVQRLALIGIQTRGVFLASRIQARLRDIEGVSVPTGGIDITLYRDDWTRISHHPVVQATHIDHAVDGGQIVLVDDVLFTGRTVRAAMDAVMDFGRPDRIELAVLVDRGHRELPIRADYVGKLVETRRNQLVNVLLTERDGIDRVVLEETGG